MKTIEKEYVDALSLTIDPILCWLYRYAPINRTGDYAVRVAVQKLYLDDSPNKGMTSLSAVKTKLWVRDK